MEHFSDHCISLLCNGAISRFLDGLDEICERSAGMDPVAADSQVFPFPAKFVIYLVTICDDRSGEVFQEFSWMISPSGRLPVIKNDGIAAFCGMILIYPHIGVLTVFDPGIVNAHYLYRCFICMNDVAFINEFMKLVVQKR